MKMSTKGRYGLRVMVELAVQFGAGPVLVDEIAKRQGISAKYIRVLIAGLKTAGLLKAVRGPHGGYELTRAPAGITVLEVVTALEGSLAPVDCVADASHCNRAGCCATRDVWCDVAMAIERTLAGVTLEQLAMRQKAKVEMPQVPRSYAF